MLSPAARHRQQKLAARAAREATAGSIAAERPAGPEASAYALLLAALGEDLARLKGIQSVENKIELKRELVANYDHHVDATLEASELAGAAVQDEIVSTMMLWHLDIGDYRNALRIAAHVLRFGLAMPIHMKRQAPTVIAEEIAEAALATDMAGQEFDLAVLDAAMFLTDKEDMPDQVRAKLFKARGRVLLRKSKAAAESESAPAGAVSAAQAGALNAFQRAYGLDKRCGVKKDIETLARKVEPVPED